MSELTNLGFGNGRVELVPAIEERPATVERSRSNGMNLTIENKGVPGRPAHYEVDFGITAAFEEGGIDYQNIFHWAVVILNSDEHAQYRTVEAEAARRVAPMLRAVADRIEQEVRTFDERLLSGQPKT